MAQATDESFQKTTGGTVIFFLYTEPLNTYSTNSIWVMFVYSCTAIAVAYVVVPTCGAVAYKVWEGGKDGKEGGRE